MNYLKYSFFLTQVNSARFGFHPMEFLSAYLDYLYIFLSENVYFYYHRESTSENIQVSKVRMSRESPNWHVSQKGADLRKHDPIHSYVYTCNPVKM